MSAPSTDPADAGRLVEPERFRHAFRQVPSPVAVVLTRDVAGHVRGITCTSATALSGTPPMALVSVGERTGIGQMAQADGWFSINFLAADRIALARAFATGGLALADTPVRIGFGRTGTPVLTSGTVSVLECGVASAHRGGDHWVLHGLVHHARFQAEITPLCYARGRYGSFVPEEGSAGQPGSARSG